MIRFQRGEYKGKFKKYDTKTWHILDPRLEGFVKTARTLTARCGYEWDNIFMDARISRATKRPPEGNHCKSCIRKEKEAAG